MIKSDGAVGKNSDLAQQDAARTESIQADSHGKESFARFIAWLLLSLSAALFLVGLTLLLMVPGEARGQNTYRTEYLIGFILFFYSLLGALIAARHPRNPIGWIFIAMGLGAELHVLALGILTFSHYRSPAAIQVPLIFFSLLYNPFILVRALAHYNLLIFPDGKFYSPRWRMVAWISVFLGAAWYFFSIPAPAAGLPAGLFHPIVQSVLPGISPSVDVLVALIAGALIEVFFILATVGIILRMHQARGNQREQLKWIVYASVLAALITLGLTILDSIPMFQASLAGSPGSASLGLPILREIAFASIPVAAFIAIYKYRLYDIDLIINRTLVYVPLTAILAGLYAATVSLLQRLFVAYTGQRSDAAAVISTLILAATFTPVKNSLQASVDRRFKEPLDPLKELKAFGTHVEAVTGLLDPRRVTRRLLEISMAAFHAGSGAIYLLHGGQLVLEHASSDWKKGSGAISLPLVQNGIQLGRLELGPRKDNRDYSSEERQALQREVDRVAEMLWLARSIGVGERSAPE